MHIFNSLGLFSLGCNHVKNALKKKMYALGDVSVALTQNYSLSVRMA